jgi:hypothetical protein
MFVQQKLVVNGTLYHGSKGARLFDGKAEGGTTLPTCQKFREKLNKV